MTNPRGTARRAMGCRRGQMMNSTHADYVEISPFWLHVMLRGSATSIPGFLSSTLACRFAIAPSPDQGISFPRRHVISSGLHDTE